MADAGVLNFRIQTSGDRQAEDRLTALDQSATRTGARFDQTANRIAGSFNRIAQSSAGLDAIRRRTDLLVQGLNSVSTRSASLTKLQGAEASLQAALQRGNLTLEQRIRLEQQLLKVQGAVASQQPATAVAAPVGIAGRARAAAGGAALTARSALGGFAGAFAGTLAVGAAMGAISGTTRFLNGMADASDELEVALRKLNATSRLTGVAIGDLRGLALEARDKFALAEVAAVDLTAQVTKLAQRAGDSSRAGEAMAAWLDLAAANGLSVDEALQGLNTTLAGNDEGLNRLNLQNPMQIWKAWGDEIGKTVANMTEQDKWMAILVDVTRQGAKVSGEYAKSLDTAAGAAQRSSLELRALQAELGSTVAPVRKLSSEFTAGFWAGTRREVEFLTGSVKRLSDSFLDAAGNLSLLTSGQALGNFIAKWKQIGLDRIAEGVTGGSSTTAEPVTPEDAEKAFDLLVRSLELGTATAAMRRGATQALQGHRAAARDDSLALEERNKHAERAVALEEALGLKTEKTARTLTDRTNALIALTAMEGPQVDRWEKMIQRAGALQEALDAGTLSVYDRVEALEELRAIEAATFPASLPPDRMEPKHAIDIRRPNAGTMPLDLSDPILNVPEIPGGEGSIFGRLVAQLEADGATAAEAFATVEERIKAAAESLTATFEAGVIGAFAAIGSGAGVGDSIAQFTGTMLAAIGEMAIKFGLAAIQIGSLMQTIMNALASLGPVGAIAAGAALVALGAALKGAAGNSFGGASGGSRQTFAPIERTINIGSAPAAASAPATATTSASAAGPSQTFHFTVIGQHDPVAQRQIAGMVRAATARGA